MIIWQGNLKAKKGMRDQYMAELNKADLLAHYRSQKGNIFYTIGAAIDDSDTIYVCDAWKTKEDFDNHCASADTEEWNIWNSLYEKYAEECKSNTIEVA